jgi:hypothetical protein
MAMVDGRMSGQARENKVLYHHEAISKIKRYAPLYWPSHYDLYTTVGLRRDRNNTLQQFQKMTP